MNRLFIVVLVMMLVGCGKGDTGAQGRQGIAGNIGATGAAGPAGSDGNSITPVQFCAGQPQVYPSSFPEYGLCINGDIYGVYWDNTNSFLAKLSPGAYTSTSTGLQCTFNILPGCVVQ
jgi:hypothetical protein